MRILTISSKTGRGLFFRTFSNKMPWIWDFFGGLYTCYMMFYLTLYGGLIGLVTGGHRWSKKHRFAEVGPKRFAGPKFLAPGFPGWWWDFPPSQKGPRSMRKTIWCFGWYDVFWTEYWTFGFSHWLMSDCCDSWCWWFLSRCEYGLLLTPMVSECDALASIQAMKREIDQFVLILWPFQKRL